MSQCCAYGKDHRRCRLWAVPNSITCFVHQHYYTNWFNTHPGFYSLNFVSKRQLKEYIFQFRHGYVKLPLSHVQSIPGNWYDYYNTVIMYTDYCPLVNRTCLRNVINILIRGAFVPISPLVYDTNVFEDLRYFLKNPAACETVFEMLITAGIELLSWGWRAISRTRESVARVYSGFFLLEEWRQIACGVDLYPIYRKAVERYNDTHIVRAVFDPAFAELLMECRLHHRKQVAQRIKGLREDLQQHVLHPLRIERLIQTYGIDVLDTL